MYHRMKQTYQMRRNKKRGKCDIESSDINNSPLGCWRIALTSLPQSD